MRRFAFALMLAALTLAPSLAPTLPASPPSQAAGRSESAPPWAPGCQWKWTADQSVSFCMTLGPATIRINRITGNMVDRVVNLTVENGTDVYRVDAAYSETLTGTLTVLGFPTPINWPVTGNGTFLHRIPDLALVYSYQHIAIDMGALGTFTVDTSTAASPPAEYYRFPLDLGDSWHFSSDLTVWTKTGGAGGAFEATSQDELDLKATVTRMEDATVPAGTLSCYNLTYNGTYTTGGSASPQNGSALYSPKATNLAFRNFSPMAGLNVVFALSEYSLNHAPAVRSPVPQASFPEDTVGGLDLYLVFSDPDAGDKLGFSAQNFTNITTTVDNSTGLASFSPPANWSGSEKMVFTATDGKGARARTEVNVTVTPVNDAPVLLRPLPGIIMDEDTVNDTLDLTQHFGDADFPFGDRLVFSFNGNGSVGASISPSGIVRLRPLENWSGVQNITITATDAAGSPASGLLKVAVLNTPDAPVVVATSHNFTILEDEGLAVDISARFWDADIPYGDVLEYAVLDLPDGWDAALDGHTGALGLSPPGDFAGTTKAALTAQDRGGLEAAEPVELRVLAENDPPVILGAFPAAESRTMPENSSADFSVVARDVDDSSLECSWRLDGEGTGTGQNFTYQPDFSSAGKHNLTATVSDGRLEVSRTWSITVTNVNRPPRGQSILSPPNGTKLSFGGKANFTADCSDPDGDPLTFTWRDTNGKVLGTGRSFETKALSNGKHVVTVEVSDGNATVSASVTVSVSPPPKARVPGFGLLSFLAAGSLLWPLAKRRRRGAREAAAPAK